MEDLTTVSKNSHQPEEPCFGSSNLNDPSSAHHSHRQVPSIDLLKGAKSVEISHNGAVYRLQATKLGKLILTK